MTDNLSILLFITFLLSSSAIYLSHIYFRRKKIVDLINERSSHQALATRSGGLGVFLSVFIVSLFYYLIDIKLYDYSYIIPLGLLLVVGLYDDLYQMDFKLKFIFQIIAAKILIDNGLLINNLHGVFGIFELNRVFAQLITIFIIVAIINSINFIDGVDGLAISVVTLFIICFEFFSNTTSPYLILSLMISVSLAPMFYFNLKKQNKVFLGDSGSLLLGGLISIYVIYILTNNYIIKPKFDIHKIIFVISILLYPIVDIIRIFFLRIYLRKSPFEPDKRHIHHFLLRKTNRHYKVTILITLISIVFIFIVQSIF